MNVPFISGDFIQQNTDFTRLIDCLEEGFTSSNAMIPMRHHHDFDNGENRDQSTLLLMPAWEAEGNSGVKVVTVTPDNTKVQLPSINGIYIHIDSSTGQVKSILEAKELTAKRTAAASALASRFLSREDASSLLMIGTGALASNLIRAHASVRPIKDVYIVGRSIEKAQKVVDEFIDSELHVQAISSAEQVMSHVDIISCATLSPTPLIKGKSLSEGQHIDLVGSYKPTMREADDDVIQQGSIFVDTYPGALKETGDIVIPIASGILQPSDLKGDLFELCKQQKEGRTSSKEITVFKSVGYALEDLLAATHYYELWKQQ